VNNSSDYSGDPRASSLPLQRATRRGESSSVHSSPSDTDPSNLIGTSDRNCSLLAAASSLRAALEQAGDGLASANLGTLLASEIALAAALAVLPTERGEADETRDEVLQELARARNALTRCRRLGGALSEMVRVTMGSQGRTGAYAANGRQTTAYAPGALEARG
jgi:hypothetical protein